MGACVRSKPTLMLSTLLLVVAFTSIACRALETVEKVGDSTAEVGDKMDKTNDGIDRTNKKMDETNGSIDETNRKMDDVRKQMSEMNDKLVETNKRMNDMNRALDRMYQDLRQGDALSARLKTIDKMVETPALKGKTLFAAQYFMSFEYQLWKGEGFDDQTMQAVLLRSAVDEFVQVLRRLSHSGLTINALSEDNDLLSLEALAISAHMINPNADYTLQPKNIAPQSMHGLLQNALNFGYKLERSEISADDIPEYAQFALKEIDLVRYFFEVRFNTLAALVLNSMSEVGSDQFFSRWSSRAGVWISPWQARTEKLNEIQLKECLRWLTWANADVSFLKSIAVKPRTDSALLKSFKNMRFVEAEQLKEQTSAAAVARLRALAGLKTEVDRFIAQFP